MSALPQLRLSEDEYLAMDATSETKHEYFRGEVFAMSGASLKHNWVVANTLASLHIQLRPDPCGVLPSDIRIKVSETGLYTYPDITVVCGEPELIPHKPDTLLNPALIVEVLSPSTERYDRGRKFEHYRTLNSLKEYVLIAQDAPQVECFVRQTDDTWLFHHAVGLETSIEFKSIGCTLTLAEIYNRVEFEPERPISPEES